MRALRNYRPRHNRKPNKPSAAAAPRPAATPDPLDDLIHGIPVPEYGLRVPWGITREQLYALIPRRHFRSRCDCWPRLRFTLYGVRADYLFNFVSRSDGRLSAVGFSDATPRARAYVRCRTMQRARLGRPNSVDGHRQDTWRRDAGWICHAFSSYWRPPDERIHRERRIQVFVQRESAALL